MIILKQNKKPTSTELIHLDYQSIELGKGQKDVNILIITDHFKR